MRSNLFDYLNGNRIEFHYTKSLLLYPHYQYFTVTYSFTTFFQEHKRFLIKKHPFFITFPFVSHSILSTKLGQRDRMT